MGKLFALNIAHKKFSFFLLTFQKCAMLSFSLLRSILVAISLSDRLDVLRKKVLLGYAEIIALRKVEKFIKFNTKVKVNENLIQEVEIEIQSYIKIKI